MNAQQIEDPGDWKSDNAAITGQQTACTASGHSISGSQSGEISSVRGVASQFGKYQVSDSISAATGSISSGSDAHLEGSTTRPSVGISPGTGLLDSQPENRALTDTSDASALQVKSLPGDSVTTKASDADGARVVLTTQSIPKLLRAESSALFDGYKRRSNPRDYFETGVAFQVLVAVPAGELSVASDPIDYRTSDIFPKIQRYIVIMPAEKHSSCLAIQNYGSRGVGQIGVTKSEHCIVHTGSYPPKAMSGEHPGRGEQGMRDDPIRLVALDPTDQLDSRSRLDFGMIHRVPHTSPVRKFGYVHEASMSALRHQFSNVRSDARARAGLRSSKRTATPVPVASSSRRLAPAAKETLLGHDMVELPRRPNETAFDPGENGSQGYPRQRENQTFESPKTKSPSYGSPLSGSDRAKLRQASPSEVSLDNDPPLAPRIHGRSSHGQPGARDHRDGDTNLGNIASDDQALPPITASFSIRQQSDRSLSNSRQIDVDSNPTSQANWGGSGADAKYNKAYESLLDLGVPPETVAMVLKQAVQALIARS